MTRFDRNGTEHVSGTDETNEWGDEHIAACQECAERFPVSAYLIKRRQGRRSLT